LATFALEPLPPAEPRVLLGNALLQSAQDVRISADRRACASFPPAGRDDGLYWRTGGELSTRQTPMLDGRIASTAPYGWIGQHATLEQHLESTVQHRLRGEGLDAEALARLVAHVRALPGPPVRHDVLGEAEARGRQLYHRADVGCGDCHDDDGGVDGLQYSLAGAVATDTPSLRHVAGGAPYFHDGRFATLDAVLTHTAGSMGQSAALTGSERADLVAYLQTL
jgi:cytochrome c peroxidase